ncbi:carbon-monoxide dehydrogenase medium subunit [Limimonas halophila]|uniref:Carbon-monoxide dehydrogenase medium subunit n=1 Tax=Limimonas halophila TaxID=1082479 RepID=A0A1G7NVA5_9PROT|nr:xanthine dehydrogenase family protein subunit M [Limimonas halophila]SDF77259.1 carbon-monoxide dehydrogenase medium subunit [Limimonas halophila]
MYEFDYHKPGSLEEAAKLLSSEEDASLIAGGMTLLPTMKQRLAAPTSVIDLSGIPGLKGVSTEGNSVVVGAMTTHNEVASDATVRSKIPALAELAGQIGDAQVRNRGTIGGSIANNDPAADYPAAIVGLGATVRTNQREVAADDFFEELFETALEDGEIVTQVVFPVPEKAGYRKFHNPASRYAIVGTFVSSGPQGTRVAVTGAGPCVFRVPEMEQALASAWKPEAVDGIRVSADELNTDLHASAEYRAHLVTVMARRAVQAAG